MTNFFPNLNSIWIHDSGLREITKNDLKKYPQLRVLKLRSNKIKVIEKNLFVYTKNLEVVDFMNNQIFHIDPKAFSSLNELIILDMRVNDCGEDLIYGEKINLKKIVKKIEDGICVNLQALEMYEKFKCSTNENFFIYSKLSESLEKVSENDSQKVFITILIIGVILIVFSILTIFLIFFMLRNKEKNMRKKFTQRSFDNVIYEEI